MTDRITIFGYGPTGKATAERLARARTGDRHCATTQARGASQRRRFAACDALDRESVLAAARGSGQIVVAIGFPYEGKLWRDAWPKAIGQFRRVPARRPARAWSSSTISTCTARRPRRWSRPCRSRPTARSRPRGRSRPAIWMEASAQGRARVAALRRAGLLWARRPVGLSRRHDDRRARSGKAASFIGSPDIPHDYAYVPDIAPRRDDLLDAPDSAFGRPGTCHARQPARRARNPADRSRRARRPAPDPFAARALLAPIGSLFADAARNARDALPVEPAVPGRREQVREGLLVRRHPVRDGRARDRAVVPQKRDRPQRASDQRLQSPDDAERGHQMRRSRRSA